MIALALAGAFALAAAPAPPGGNSGSAAPAASGATQPGAPAAGTAPAAPAQAAPAQGPDLELHVPKAGVKKVSLDVENLQTRLDIDTQVANLVQINAGVVATVQKLKLELEDVEAETHLLVRLDRLAEVMEAALGTIDHNPSAAGAQPVQASTRGPVAPATAIPRAQAVSVIPGAPQPAPSKE